MNPTRGLIIYSITTAIFAVVLAANLFFEIQMAFFGNPCGLPEYQKVMMPIFIVIMGAFLVFSLRRMRDALCLKKLLDKPADVEKMISEHPEGFARYSRSGRTRNYFRVYRDKKFGITAGIFSQISTFYGRSISVTIFAKSGECQAIKKFRKLGKKIRRRNSCLKSWKKLLTIQDRGQCCKSSSLILRRIFLTVSAK